MQTNISIKKTARLAGFLYFLQIPLGVLGIVYVPKLLINVSDTSVTVNNILQNESLFRWGIFSAILCALVTIGTAVYLSKVLKPVDKKTAKWIVIFTLIVAPITMINELNNMAILLLLKNNGITLHFTTNQVEALVTLFLDIHKYGIYIVDIFFGLWLLPMGYLVIKSGYIPKIIGYFLIITCVGYLLDFTLYTLNLNNNIIISEYTWIGEVMMVTWLLVKGVKTSEFESVVKNVSNKIE